jgi:hypothetical protein
MPWAVPLAMVAGSVISNVAGNNAASADRDAATAARQDAVKQWLSVNVPDPEQQRIELENYQVTGKLSPQLEQAFQQSDTGLKSISLDPSSRAAEMAALTKMQDIARNGGMDAESEQQIAQAVNKVNANEKGQREAIIENAAARGMGKGGGASIAAQLLASQAGADRAAESGMSAASSAQMRALQALSQSANLGATLNNQDYSQKAAAAEAQDAINRFNSQNSQNVANANVTNANAAQAANLANAQSVANANTGVHNQQEQFNKGLTQQFFNNQTAKAAGASGQYAGVAQNARQNATDTANQWSGIGQSLSQGLGAYGQYANNQSQLDAYNKRTDAMAAKKDDDGGGYAEGGEVKKPSRFEALLEMVRQSKGLANAVA